jgi:hypothetical protein
MRLCHRPDGSTSPKYKLLCLYHLNLFYQIQAALVFNRDTCCHLVLCLWLLPFHCKSSSMFIRPPHNPSANLFVCPSVYVSVRPSLCLSVSYARPPFYLFAYSSICATICPSTSISLSLCQSIYLSSLCLSFILCIMLNVIMLNGTMLIDVIGNDIQHNNIQHCDTQYNGHIEAFSAHVR